MAVTTQSIRNNWKSKGKLKMPPLKRKSTEQSTYLHNIILHQMHTEIPGKYHQVRYGTIFLVHIEKNTHKAHLIHLKKAQWELCPKVWMSLWPSHLHTTEKLTMRQKDKLALNMYLWLSYFTLTWNFNKQFLNIYARKTSYCEKHCP